MTRERIKKETRLKRDKQCSMQLLTHPLTDAQPVPEQGAAPPSQLPQLTLCLECLFGQSRAAVLAVSLPAFLCISSLAQQGKLRVLNSGAALCNNN